jgi:hypothetical protein
MNICLIKQEEILGNRRELYNEDIHAGKDDTFPAVIRKKEVKVVHVAYLYATDCRFKIRTDCSAKGKHSVWCTHISRAVRYL